MVNIQSITAIGVGILSGAVLAQQPGLDALPTCGQLCVQDMINLAGDLGCAANDLSCLCMNPDFTYGIRDCSNAVCSGADEANRPINFGYDLCLRNGVSVQPGSDATVTASPETTTVTGNGGQNDGVATAIITTIVTDGETFTSTIDAGTATDGAILIVSTFTTVITDGDEIVTSVGETTLREATATGLPVVSTIVSDGSTIITTITDGAAETDATFTSIVTGWATETSDGTGSQSEASDVAESTTTSDEGQEDDAAGQPAAGPLAGLFAAAGILVFMF